MESIADDTAVAGINVLLVDDHAIFRESLARVLEKESGISVVGPSATCAEALAKLARSGANMVLLDVDLGPERPLDFIVEAKTRGYSGQILVVTAGVSGPEAVQLVQGGVAGILHKHHSTEALVETIRKVAAGEKCLEQQYLSALFRSVDRTSESTRPKLTERDKKVLRFVFQGLTNKDCYTSVEWRLKMNDQQIRAALDQHWAASDANDFETEHRIYREDAVLEYPQSGERTRGRSNIQNQRASQPNKKRFSIRRIIGAGDLWVTEFILTYDGKPSYTVSIMEFQDGKVARETQYFADPFPAPAGRAQWVERMDA